MRAVVVHGQAAADVEDAHGSAFADEVDIDAHGLVHGAANRADVGNLAAHVVVNHLQAVEHVLRAQRVDDADGVRHGQTEDAAVARRFAPLAADLGRQLEAHAQARAHPERLGPFEDQVELTGHLKHDQGLHAHLQARQGEVDELSILVAVADDVGLGILHVGKGDEQLGLAAGF